MERIIDLDGCVNFRDLGGIPSASGRRVRWRTLYRSDALHALTAADVARFGGDLGITDIVDLRSTFELTSEGRGLLGEATTRFHHLPLFDGAMTPKEQRDSNALSLADRYVGLLEMAGEPIAQVVKALADAEAGAVYHCAAGKDRTGVISAVLLGALDVPRELIVADYALSADNIDAIIARVMSMKGYQDTLEKMPEDTLHAKPETMEGVVDHVDAKYGSWGAYLDRIGVSAETIRRLRDKCLEPLSDP